MQTRLTLLIMCLLLAFAVPTWGATTGSAKKAAPKKGTTVTAPAAQSAPVQSGAYKRDPRKVMEMRQYLKQLKQKQKEAGARNAAARAGQAAPAPAAPQQTEGGTK